MEVTEGLDGLDNQMDCDECAGSPDPSAAVDDDRLFWIFHAFFVDKVLQVLQCLVLLGMQL